jgi:uncharacterized protein (TIGR02118 family)
MMRNCRRSAMMKGLNRRDVVARLAVAALAASLPAPTPAQKRTPLLKILTLVARKPELSQDRFRQHWLGIHGPMARKVPGIRGFILSEAVQDSAAAAPSAPYANRFDGIAHSWFANEEALHSAMNTGEARNWLADGDSFIDRAASRNFFVREQIVVQPPLTEGGLKRSLLMVRKPGTTHDDFMAHWTGQHASLAQGVPGLLGCVFNHIETALSTQGSPWTEIDGIAEVWWDSGAQNPGGRVVSPQSDVWAADGDSFIDRARTRVIVSLEHIIVPPSAGGRGSGSA